MADIKVMREELQRVQVKAKSILQENKQGLAAEQDMELDALVRRGGELKVQIEREVKLEEKTKDLEDLDRYLREPQRTIPHGINGDDDERKTMMDAGYEFKNGVIYAPNSRGAPVPMWNEEVLFGAIPDDDPSTAKYFQTTRAIFAPEYKTAYVKHFRAMAMFGNEAIAYNKLSAQEQKALSEGSDVGGGFLVPPDAQAELLVRVAQRAVFRRFAKVQTTSRDVLKWPRIAPHPTEGSIYSSGFVGGWVGETPAFVDTDPGLGTFDVPIKKLRVATKLSNDLVADAAVNILAFLAQNGAENMALVEDSGFIAGDGSPLQPRGILNAGIATVDVEGSTANTISNSASNTGSAPKLINLVYALPDQYVENARWLMRRSIEGKVRGLVDAAGRFLWPAQTESAFSATPATLMGAPMANSSFMPNDGVDGAKVLLFGDLQAYLVGVRAQITSIVLRERFADTDQVGIILFERIGGDCWNPDALRVGIV